MKLGQAIDEANVFNPNVMTNTQKTILLSRLEGEISASVMTDLKTFSITCDSNTQSYSLGAIAITSVIKVSLNGLYLMNVVDEKSDSGYYLTNDGVETTLHLINSPYGTMSVLYQVITDKLDYENDKSKELLVPKPYDDLYVLYLEAMIYKQNKEYTDYNNHMRIFEERMNSFKEWYFKRSPKRQYRCEVVI